MSFIGLEDILIERSWEGKAGVFPGSHYILWDSEDLLNSLRFNPDLLYDAIECLSKRIRIYHKKAKTYFKRSAVRWPKSARNRY